MVEENDAIEFPKDHSNQASLDQISESLTTVKYGPNSAYALLHPLRSKGTVDRKGEMWVLLAPETPISQVVPSHEVPQGSS